MSMNKTLHPNKQDPKIIPKKEGGKKLRIRDCVSEKEPEYKRFQHRNMQIEYY